MKKIIVVLLIIVILCGAGYFTWSYLDENFRDFTPIAEDTISSGESVYFVGDYYVKHNARAINAYKITPLEPAPVNVLSLPGEFEFKAVTKDYIVFFSEGTISIFAEAQGVFARAGVIEGNLITARQYGDRLYLKCDIDSSIRHYVFNGKTTSFEDITSQRGISFSDWFCSEDGTKEYYMCYNTSNGTIRLTIRVFINGIEQAALELDNVIYYNLKHVGGMLILESARDILFISETTYVRRTIRYYDTTLLTSFEGASSIIYYAPEGYFDSKNNMVYVDGEDMSFHRFENSLPMVLYGADPLYAEGNSVYRFSLSSRLFETAKLLTVENEVKGIGVMKNGIIAVVTDSNIVFMYKESLR